MKVAFRFLLLSLVLVGSLFGITQRKVLSPEEAFNLKVQKTGEVISIKLSVGEGIYVYDDKLKISISDPKVVSLDKEIKRPSPTKHDEYLVHEKAINLLIPINLIKKYINSGQYKIKVEYQGCATSGICYQPMSKEFSFDLGSGSKKANIIEKELSEQDAIANSLKNDSVWLVLLTFFGFGLLLSLTPCIFPMIPILSSIIVSQAEKITTKRAFFLSLVYVVSMALAYTIAGVLAGLFGANIQAALQNPWIISIFSLVFVFLAFSMFGFYEIQMPRFIQSRLTKKSDEMQGHGIIGVAIMGFLSALIMGPCVAAPLAGALVYIGQSGDALLGGLSLFVMSLGMGVPLLLVGVGAKRYMPKPGVWMNNVSATFGVVMLALAIWTLSRIVDANIIMFMWTFLAIGSAVYMGALERLKDDAKGIDKLIKSMAVIILIYGAILFVGSVSGATNPLNPLLKFTQKSLVSAQIEVSEENDFELVKNLGELESIIKNSKKPILVDFYADWCVSCVELDTYTFSDPLVKSKMKNFKLVRVDVTKNSKDDKELLNKFGLFGPPAIMFFKDKQELKSKRIIGFKDSKEFLEQLNGII
ncbi:protein-disulfide reductase DsbD [Sulfurospirillum sp. 1307]